MWGCEHMHMHRELSDVLATWVDVVEEGRRGRTLVAAHISRRGRVGRRQPCAREKLPLLCSLPTHARRRGRAFDRR